MTDDPYIEMHEDGGATIHFGSQENLDRMSACVRCMLQNDLEGTDNDMAIGDEAYAQIHDGIANVLVHERCVRETDNVRERWPARDA